MCIHSVDEPYSIGDENVVMWYAVDKVSFRNFRGWSKHLQDLKHIGIILCTMCLQCNTLHTTPIWIACWLLAGWLQYAWASVQLGNMIHHAELLFDWFCIMVYPHYSFLNVETYWHRKTKILHEMGPSNLFNYIELICDILFIRVHFPLTGEQCIALNQFSEIHQTDFENKLY